MRISVRPTDGPIRCVYCHDGPGSETLHPCVSCGATSHPTCRNNAPRCSTLGCSDVSTVVAAEPEKRQWPECVGCSLSHPGLFDTTWEGEHIGHLCIGCINTGAIERTLRRRRIEHRRQEEQQAATEARANFYKTMEKFQPALHYLLAAVLIVVIMAGAFYQQEAIKAMTLMIVTYLAARALAQAKRE